MDEKALRAYMIWKLGYLDDDAVQEGLIASWQAQEKTPGKPDVYYRVAAINGAKTYLMGKRTTGRDAKGKRRNGRVNELATEDDLLHRVVEESQEYEDADLRLIVQEALDMLDEADYDYCVLRFWEGYSHVESSRLTGLHYTAWYDRIRPRLREVLSV